MKKIIILAAALLLTACGSTAPNLVRTDSPILNIVHPLDQYVVADVSTNSAWVKNKTNQTLNLAYDLFWYDSLGVTQIWQDGRESQHHLIRLAANEKANISLTKPTAESQNYRLYLQLP